MINKNIYEHDNWRNKNISYIKNNLITEYDLSSAGLNILMDLNAIDNNLYQELLSMKKLDRNVYIGKMLKSDKKLLDLQKYGFSEARRVFFEKNEIELTDVLTIKKDAIFLINKNYNIDGKISEHLNFRKKNEYNSYLYLNHREHFYDAENDSMDVKGYSDSVKFHQKEYFFKFIKNLLKLDTTNDRDKIFYNISTLKYNMINFTADLPFYRNIYTDMFNLNPLNGSIYELEDIDERLKPYLNFNVNLNVLIKFLELLI